MKYYIATFITLVFLTLAFLSSGLVWKSNESIWLSGFFAGFDVGLVACVVYYSSKYPVMKG